MCHTHHFKLKPAREICQFTPHKIVDIQPVLFFHINTVKELEISDNRYACNWHVTPSVIAVTISLLSLDLTCNTNKHRHSQQRPRPGHPRKIPERKIAISPLMLGMNPFTTAPPLINAKKLTN